MFSVLDGPRKRGVRALALALTVCCASGQAGAQNKAAADVLFEAGRRAAAEGDYATACRKFDESNRMEPAVGTLLNLGNCEERQGHWATSWLRYTEALTKLPRDDKRHIFAKGKAAELEPRIPRLIIELAADAPATTTVSRNGEKVDQAIGASVRLDPGKYTIRVEAPSHQPATYEVVLFEGDEEHLTVTPGDRIEKPRPPVVPPETASDTQAAGRRRLGYIFGGAGAAAGLAGLTFGGLTFREYLVVQDHCDHSSSGYRCRDTTGDDAFKSGSTYELIGYGLGAVGLISMGVGAYFLFVDAPAGKTELRAGAVGGSAGLTLQHTF
jgi:hypothetical protein